MNTSLHHVGLTVANLERAVEFYCAVLGCVVIDRAINEGRDMAAITGFPEVRMMSVDLELPGGGRLELLEYAQPTGARLPQESCNPGHTHVAFTVADADAAYERIVRMGGVVRSRPVQLGAPGSSWDGARVFYAVDPDGRTIEIVQPRSK
jgi:catechol 2,3-dioxygenase-like lactoylglutathione lyase family enzyme